MFACPTIVIDKRGEVFSRPTGYLPGRYVEALPGRVRGALEKR